MKKHRTSRRSVLCPLAVMLILITLAGCTIRPRPGPDSSSARSPASTVPPAESTAPATAPSTPYDMDLLRVQEQIQQSGCVAGVAYLGFLDGSLPLSEVAVYLEASGLIETHPLLLTDSLFVTPGYELYVIVPATAAGTITVHPAGLNDRGEYTYDTNQTLYEGPPGEPVVLRCNYSDIFSNVVITATDGGGAIQFSPSLSLEDGSVNLVPGLYDFTVYEEQPGDDAVEAGDAILRQIDEVQTALNRGMQLVYTGDKQLVEGKTCLLYAVGTDRDGQFVREQIYGVSGGYVYAYDALNDVWVVLGFG